MDQSHRKRVTRGTASPKPDDDLARDLKQIHAAGDFDLRHYETQLGRELSLEDAIRHYVEEGEAAALTPNATFDAEFYLRTNADVQAAGVNAYSHYLRSGKKEKRYPNATLLSVDAQIVVDADAFDADYYRRTYATMDYRGVRPLEHYLTTGWRRGRHASANFDGDFYEQNYQDAKSSNLQPLVHFIEHGFERGYRSSYEQVSNDVESVRDSAMFDERYYLEVNGLDAEEVRDPSLHFVLHGAARWLDPGPHFSTEYYLRRYPDVAAADINPLAHFERYGRSEGRKGTPPAYRHTFKRGQGELRYARRNLLILLHECSRTGAPLLGLALAQELNKRYNIIIWAGRAGGLSEDVEAVATMVGYGFGDPVDCEFILRDLVVEHEVEAAIANSVETSAVHSAILACDIPSVGLIHEFATYSRPIGKVTDVVSRLDRCIVPASIVEESAQDEIEMICGSRANNVTVRPQGHLPAEFWSSQSASTDDNHGIREQLEQRLEGKKVVLGAGFVHIRKGLDLFVETARWASQMTQTPIHFLWIGDGWMPKSDLNYGLWVDDFIQRLSLTDRVTILPAQNSIDWAFELADVFFLSSRLDPFPNVAIDAMAADVPVVCFERTTGVAEFIETTGAAGTVVPYLDTRAAAEAIVSTVEGRSSASLGKASVTASGTEAESTPHTAPDTEALGENGSIVARELALDDYTRAILAEVESAKVSVTARLRYVAEIEAAGSFDREFHDARWAHFPNDRQALKEYVARSMKGVHRYSPMPGFSDRKYAASVGPAIQTTPLIHALRKNPGKRPFSHDCVIVGQHKPLRQATQLRVGLHVHLFYADLAAELKVLLDQSGISADLYISCGAELEAREIDFQLRRYKRGKVTIRPVPNAGRDIGPFITEFGKDLLDGGYDVLGHLHGKRSADLGTGDAWRTYLWGNLLGDRDVWETVRTSFADDPTLGLMFPEDRHVVGWAKNRGFAEDLRTRLGMSQPLPDAPVFPLGTMFWCRPAAVRSLLESQLTWSDYPPEPLPYDGTILHAIERMLPTVCEETQHRWQTIYTPGSSW